MVKYALPAAVALLLAVHFAATSRAAPANMPRSMAEVSGILGECQRREHTECVLVAVPVPAFHPGDER